jgi:hypothetical protein
MRKRGLFMAIGLLFLVNAILLAGVAYNRSGPPDSVMTLTEREMPVAYTYQKENSGISLRIRTDHYFYGWTTGASDDPFAWLDRKKLETLGFDFSRVPITSAERYGYYDRKLPRRAYAVLEYDGPAWEAWKKKLMDELAKADQSMKKETLPETSPAPGERRKNIERELTTASHLFIIDVGMDPAALRQRYPDRQKYLILPAKVRVSAGKDTVRGYVDLLTPEVNVPHRLHAGLGVHSKQGSRYNIWPVGPDSRPRYQVVLHTGRRSEPWIEDVMAAQ